MQSKWLFVWQRPFLDNGGCQRLILVSRSKSCPTRLSDVGRITEGTGALARLWLDATPYSVPPTDLRPSRCVTCVHVFTEALYILKLISCMWCSCCSRSGTLLPHVVLIISTQNNPKSASSHVIAKHGIECICSERIMSHQASKSACCQHDPDPA